MATAMSQLLGLRHAGFVKTAREIDHRPAVCMAVINTDSGLPQPAMAGASDGDGSEIQDRKSRSRSRTSKRSLGGEYPHVFSLSQHRDSD